MSEIKVRRFRSADGRIYTTRPDAIRQALTTSQVRILLNLLYDELAKHDPKAAEEICRECNA